jgi:hypothetical protein
MEIRTMIWQYAMNIDTTDIATKTPIYLIEERRSLRKRSYVKRENRFSVAIVTAKALALQQTCSQIRQEVLTFNIRPSFKFCSIDIFCAFLGNPHLRDRAIDDTRLELLRSALKVTVMVSREEWPGYRLLDLARCFDGPFAVEFVDEKGDASREVERAALVWADFVDND